MQSAIAIGVGALFGALLRWKLGEFCNPIFPTLPLGTLLANLIGSFLMGCILFFVVDHNFFSQEFRLGAITGFLGSLTTFSTFSAEAFLLLSKKEYLWFFSLIGLHVAGSVFMVAAGYSVSKVIYQNNLHFF